VFLTRTADGRRLAWVVTRHEPPRSVAFAVFHGDVVETLVIELAPAGDGSELVWTRHYTGIDESGNDWIAANVPTRVEARLAALEGLLGSYLARR
jgi:hypothetical protein